MNIFILDKDPVAAAKMHCDKHVVKMILETAQMLSTAVRLTDGVNLDGLYRATHKNHPCSKWARESSANFLWLKDYGLALCAEYTNRYGKKHKSQSIIENVTADSIPAGPLTKFAIAMPDHCKISDNPVECYREYYRVEKRRFASWKYTEKPEWF